jgi:protein-disulfide isomerase
MSTRRRPAITGELSPIGERDHVLGADRPAVTLVEYGDFGCPYCFAAKRPVESLLERYDSLRLVWRHLPDPEFHPGADLAAELSELAATKGRFWDAHGMLLAGRERISSEDLLSVGQRLGFDSDEVEEALDGHRFRERVEEDIAGGKRAGAPGTPTFFVNGERLVGHWRQLAQVVPAAIAAH